MSTERPACGLGSLLPMSCRGRAEAFARRLHSRLQTLGRGGSSAGGSVDARAVDENSWLDPQTVTTCQPRLSTSSESDPYFDFDLDPCSPASPADDQPHRGHDPESGCILSSTSLSPGSDSSDGPYFDLENTDTDHRPFDKCNGHVFKPTANCFTSNVHKDNAINELLNGRDTQDHPESPGQEIQAQNLPLHNTATTLHFSDSGIFINQNGERTQDQKSNDESNSSANGCGNCLLPNDEASYCSTFSRPSDLIVESTVRCAQDEEECDLVSVAIDNGSDEEDKVVQQSKMLNECLIPIQSTNRDIINTWEESKNNILNETRSNADTSTKSCVTTARDDDNISDGVTDVNTRPDERLESEDTPLVLTGDKENDSGEQTDVEECPKCEETGGGVDDTCAQGGDVAIVIVSGEVNLMSEETEEQDPASVVEQPMKDAGNNKCSLALLKIDDESHSEEEATSKCRDDTDDDDSTPHVRRCSSLKTGKTPPGTPGRKKIVRFADVLGLDLADVRTFMDEIPKIPSSAYSDLHNADLSLGSPAMPVVGCHNMSLNLNEPIKCLVPLFQQPGGQPDFLDRVRERQVCLENAVVKDAVMLSISGTVRVKNLDFHKSVHIRYSIDGWNTYSDMQATYVSNSCDGFSDTFTFLLYAHTLVIGQRLEFAVRFQCKGSQFWDNNQGANYTFQCLPPASSTPYLPLPSPEDRWVSFY